MGMVVTRVVVMPGVGVVVMPGVLCQFDSVLFRRIDWAGAASAILYGHEGDSKPIPTNDRAAPAAGDS